MRHINQNGYERRHNQTNWKITKFRTREFRVWELDPMFICSLFIYAIAWIFISSISFFTSIRKYLIHKMILLFLNGYAMDRLLLYQLMFSLFSVNNDNNLCHSFHSMRWRQLELYNNLSNRSRDQNAIGSLRKCSEWKFRNWM